VSNQAPYRVDIVKHAQRQIRSLAPQIQRRVLSRITALGADPRPTGTIKLAGPQDLYRIRVGEYRVIYTIEDDVLLVLVVSVGHRREIYRDL
jgi:mRNA interferase RelE/StbE